jgi:hypothetical protein
MTKSKIHDILTILFQLLFMLLVCGYHGYKVVDSYILLCVPLSGNMVGHFPYKTGKPCSKCASGKGWCYENLCS